MSSLSLPIDRVLELIKTNRSLRASILEKDDSVVDIIYRYIDTPNCSACVNKVQEFVNQNIDFINTLVQNIPIPIVVKEEAVSPVSPAAKVVDPARPAVPTPVKVAGEVYEIDADPNQYKELIELSQSQRWVYRGMAVMERVNEDGKKVWMLMFY